MSRPLPSTPAWLVALAAAALSVAALIADLRREARVPSDAALHAAAERIRDGFREGDAVVLVPPWLERPWEMLRGAGPGAREWPFPALLRGGRVDPATLLRYDRAWVLAAFDTPTTPPGILDEDREAVSEDTFDGVRVALHDLASVEVLARLTDDLGHLDVRRRRPSGEVIPCRPAGKRQRCGIQGWLDPHLERRDVFHRDVEWIYAHPGPGRASLVMDWNGVPRGAALLVRAGYTQAGVRHDEGAPATVRVLLGGREVDRFSLAPWTYALERRLLRLPEADGPLDVTFEVQSEDPRWREVMLQAEVLDRIPASVAADATADVTVE
ncbi:MAG: hypothetical protein ACQEXJ_11395 [Myxococcota bacterium]